MSPSEITRAPVTIENIAPKPLPLVFRPVPRRTPSCIARTPVAALASRPREAVGRAALRCWVLSDLRIGADSDFALPSPLPDFDILLVAGGIAPGLDASLTWLARALDGRHGSRPVAMVPGPLEFRSEVPLVEALAQGRELAGTYGISLVSDESIRLEAVDVGGGHVVGATLWTDWALQGAFQGRLARVGARHDWPDGKGIFLRRGRPLTPLDALAVHARSRAYIEDALAGIVHQALGYRAPPNALIEDVRPGDRAIVLTCHAPSRHSLPYDPTGALRDPRIAASRASDLEDVLQAWGAPTLWVHGNVPTATSYRVAGTNVVANPRGDPGSSFDPSLVVEG